MKIFYSTILADKLISSHSNIKNSEPGSLFFLQACRIAVRCTALLLGASLLACDTQTDHEEIVFTGPTMGTTYQVKIVPYLNQRTEVVDSTALASEIEKVLETINASMSTYLPTSEVSRFNRLSANQPQNLSPPLLEVLQISQRISELTDGAFDITVGPAVRAWGFGAEGRKQAMPTEAQIEKLKSSVGYRNLVMSGNTLLKKHAATEIDLSAVAKGFAIDQLARLLDSWRITDYLIEVGGELKAQGLNSRGESWRVAIEKPVFGGGVLAVVDLRNSAIATSGDYRNFVQFNGKSYSHTIDPVTAKPVVHRLASVTVLHRSAAQADALATAMMVMGVERAMRFSEKNSISSLFIVRTGQSEQYEIKKVGDFTQLLQ